MNTTGLIFLLLAHYITGRGVLKLFNLELTDLSRFCLSMIVSLPVLSLVPCALQLLEMHLNAARIYHGISIMTALFAVPLFVKFKKPQLPKLTLPRLYELPFIAAFICLLLISVWRCYYYPPTARDMLAGPEV